MRKDIRDLFNNLCTKQQKEKLTHKESKATIVYSLATTISHGSVERDECVTVSDDTQTSYESGEKFFQDIKKYLRKF